VWGDRSFAERHMAMTGFCSCKIGIHVIHGNNLCSATETGVQYRHETCEKCQIPVRINACVDDPVAIKQILDHLASKESGAEQTTLPPGRAPPQLGLFDA
jgi:hypothetical protein